MITRRKHKVFILLLLFIATIVIGFVFNFQFSGALKSVAENGELVTEVLNEYYLDSEFSLPDTAEIRVSENQTIQAKNPKIIYPSGVVRGAGTHVLDEKGTYRVIYFGEYNGQVVTAEKEFFVNEYTWKYSEKSEASFGTLSRKPLVEGISVDIGDGDSFAFMKTVDLTDLKSLDICKMYPTLREEVGAVTASMITVKVVDALDPETFVEVYLWTQGKGAHYAGAAASHQNFTGLEASSSGSFFFEDRTYKKHTKQRYQTSATYGSVVYGSATGTAQGLVSAGGMSVRLDLQTMKVYWVSTSAQILVTDLDAPEIYGDNLFKGFTSNQVYATVQYFNTTQSKVNVQIESLLGFSGDELQKAVIQDNVKPIVTLDIDKTDELGVYVAKGEECVLPTAVNVTDVNYNGDLKVEVVYNYGSSKPIKVFVKDGKFIPKLDGVYTVTYTATDIFGNEGVAILQLNVISDKKAISYVETKIDVLHAAKINYFPEIDATGLNKDVTASIEVVDPKGEKTTLADDRSYIPQYLGEYTVIYTFRDNLYTREFSYKINTIDEGNVLFTGLPKLPPYMIADGQYMLEEYYAYTLGKDGLDAHLTTASISIDGGNWKEVSYDEVITVKGSDTFRVKYAYNGKETIFTKQIIDVGFSSANRDYIKYFQGTYETAETTPVSLIYNFDGTQETEYLEFVNAVALSKFKFAFNIPEEKANFDSVKITLTDYSDQNNIVEIVYAKNNDTLIYKVIKSINGIRVLDSSTVLETTFVGNHTISYKEGEGLTNGSEGVLLSMDTFDSELVMFTVTLDGVSGASALEIKELNNQKLNGDRITERAPELCMQGAGSGKMGATYTVTPAILSSVLNCPLRKDLKLSVTAPDGTYVKSIQGDVLNYVNGAKSYSFILAMAGDYRVSYTCSSGSNAGLLEAEGAYLIAVRDSVAPVIEFEGGLNEQSLLKVKVGEVHKIRAYTVSDNETAQELLTVQLFVLNSSGISIIGNDVITKEIVFFETGYYTVRVWCMDAYGNVATKYYNVLVEEV